MPKPKMGRTLGTEKPKSKTGNSIQDKFRSQKKNLMKRHQEQVDSKDQGSEFPTIFDKSKIPPGINFWKCGKGEHIIDIIPFIAGSQHPRVPEGELSYVVDLWIHTNVGPLRTPYPCEAKNFKGSDPICEYIAKNRLDKDEWKRVSSKRRTVYLVWVHDTPEEEKKGIQIWEVSHFFFEQHIDEIAKSPRGGGAVAFSDIDSGKSIAFKVKVTGKYKDGDTDRDSISYTGHQFIDRDYDVVPDRILEQSFALDECINMHPDYEEMAEAFFGPSKPKKYKPVEDDDDDNEPDNEQEDEQDEGEGAVCLVCNGSGKTAKGKQCATCEGTGEYFDTEDDIPSKGKKAVKGRKAPEPEPDEEEDEPEEEENDDAEETEDEGVEEEDSEDDGEDSVEDDVTECPHDPDSFGEVDEHPECEAGGGCPLWDSCSDEATRRQVASKAKEKEKKPLASSTTKKKKLGKK